MSRMEFKEDARPTGDEARRRAKDAYAHFFPAAMSTEESDTAFKFTVKWAQLKRETPGNPSVVFEDGALSFIRGSHDCRALSFNPVF